MNQDSIPKIARAYSYVLPQELIAQRPDAPREAARLMVYDRKAGTVIHDTFRNIGKYLPARSLIIFNDTRVIPARLKAKKQTGGTVEIFFLSKNRQTIKAFMSPRLNIGSRAYLNKKIFFEVIGQDKKLFTLKPNFPIKNLDAILQKYGTTPLPPYIKNSPLTEKQARLAYQTVFAKAKGSVAAPTASLHFSKRLLGSLKKQGHQIAFITLHVNLGTFAPLTNQQVKENRLHQEYFYIPEKTAKMIRAVKKQKRTIIACGTTVTRALESGNRKANSKEGSKWRQTDLFIRSPYKFRIINGLITNFHLPQSSLLMLVGAFMGRQKLMSVYKQAIGRKYRFYSFGDGMLIL